LQADVVDGEVKLRVLETPPVEAPDSAAIPEQELVPA
jgi:hypothetical protein